MASSSARVGWGCVSRRPPPVHAVYDRRSLRAGTGGRGAQAFIFVYCVARCRPSEGHHTVPRDFLCVLGGGLRGAWGGGGSGVGEPLVRACSTSAPDQRSTFVYDRYPWSRKYSSIQGTCLFWSRKYWSHLLGSCGILPLPAKARWRDQTLLSCDQPGAKEDRRSTTYMRVFALSTGVVYVSSGGRWTGLPFVVQKFECTFGLKGWCFGRG